VSKAAVKDLAKRVAAIEAARAPPREVAWIVIGEAEDRDMALASWRAENPEKNPTDVIYRIVLSGIPQMETRLPDPEKCTRASVLEAIPAVKARLAKWSGSGAGGALSRVAAHWQMLCEKFQIAE
jgi:hypothetical protein